ncbi:MAG: hypothetical protein K0Q49_943 [Haloplasmataceae bacterium]|jgi:hypothetical protein|nr:hypothetical protein [Haloplasmataceae bacterium]
MWFIALLGLLFFVCVLISSTDYQIFTQFGSDDLKEKSVNNQEVDYHSI